MGLVDESATGRNGAAFPGSGRHCSPPSSSFGGREVAAQLIAGSTLGGNGLQVEVAAQIAEGANAKMAVSLRGEASVAPARRRPPRLP